MQNTLPLLRLERPLLHVSARVMTPCRRFSLMPSSDNRSPWLNPCVGIIIQTLPLGAREMVGGFQPTNPLNDSVSPSGGIGCRGWDCTSIRAFKGRCPTIRRPGNELARRAEAPSEGWWPARVTRPVLRIKSPLHHFNACRPKMVTGIE